MHWWVRIMLENHAVLRALDFLFNPSTKLMNEESFWNKDTNLEIRVEAIFSNLTNKEKGSIGRVS